MIGRSCNDYCGQHGLSCAGAWEEVNNDCAVKETLSCSSVFPGTSDLLCECKAAEEAPRTAEETRPRVGAGSWTHRPSLNCFPGRGGGIIPGKDQVGIYVSLKDCQ